MDFAWIDHFFNCKGGVIVTNNTITYRFFKSLITIPAEVKIFVNFCSYSYPITRVIPFFLFEIWGLFLWGTIKLKIRGVNFPIWTHVKGMIYLLYCSVQ